ncbi:MAG TPA: VWA domain-containing protein [Terriglobales bacterium]|nr:VWA domain-containing protein [Terriglobales bacterium]
MLHIENRRRGLTFVTLICLVLWVGQGLLLSAQNQPSNSSPNKQDTPPEAGGPQTDVGPYAIPKKKEEPPPPPVEKPKKIEGMPDYSIRVNVPLVNVDVMVTTKDGQFINGLKKDNFKIYEDGNPQPISNFGQSQAPITAVLLTEFASTNYYLINEMLTASYYFAQGLKKEDYVAVVSYDMKTQILLDFTQDKNAVKGAINSMRIPGFSETNLFDALFETLDRVDRIEGHKYIILITTGIDTFSKLNLDQITKKIKATHDVTIFPISIGWYMRTYCETHNCYGAGGMARLNVTNLDYLQADNELNTFAKLTGGRAYFPRFEGEFPELFHDILGDVRNQYNIAYHPTNPKQDGSYRKLRVEVVAPDGGPLKVRDQKGKDVKYQIITREGYYAKNVVE